MDTIMETKPFAESELSGRVIMVEGGIDPVGAFRCDGGFGCSPTSNGGKVYGQYIASGEKTYVRRGWATGFADEVAISKAQDWSTRPSWEINPVLAANTYRICNDKVMEAARDDGGRVSKDQLRATLMEVLCGLAEVKGLLDEVAKDCKEPALEGVNGYQAE